MILRSLRTIAVFVLLLAAHPVLAQQNKSALDATITTNIPDNGAGRVTPYLLRQTLYQMVASSQQFTCVNNQAASS
jgi:hypothetical protein